MRKYSGNLTIIGILIVMVLSLSCQQDDNKSNDSAPQACVTSFSTAASRLMSIRPAAYEDCIPTPPGGVDRASLEAILGLILGEYTNEAGSHYFITCDPAGEWTVPNPQVNEAEGAATNCIANWSIPITVADATGQEGGGSLFVLDDNGTGLFTSQQVDIDFSLAQQNYAGSADDSAPPTRLLLTKSGVAGSDEVWTRIEE